MPIREIDTGSRRELTFEYHEAGERQGDIRLRKVKRASRQVWEVAGVFIRASARRRGLGTKLYERAARAACESGAPLASTERVGEGMSDAFWEKQLRKGRASVLCKRCGTGGQPVYVLSCPAPSSLRGARKKR